MTTAPDPSGPWSAARTLLRGPHVHAELFDPLSPDQLVISYSVGTTAADGEARRLARPEAYWPRVVQVDR